MSNEACFTLVADIGLADGVAALLASPALMVMTPSRVLSFSTADLIASATAVGLPKPEEGSGSWLDLRGLGDGVGDALAAVFGVGRAWQCVDAQHVLGAMAAVIGAPRRDQPRTLHCQHNSWRRAAWRRPCRRNCR